ncbi:aldo/keto reductase [Thalassotalea profundi]|uniref:Aldo/keto reductase n=1 Tax=Thalassotalea profundi TaxID=2036687 RepID=A0ABQ3IZS0_9GAMM|nr:aldo/keto reductase [Thalassotalea profundi]GHE98001.1 aldo/keto reductase [Thalassotalea profundi]
MEFSRLGSSNIEVSRVCLGSMTWGIQNNQSDANLQIDYAINQGINFIDTAEMYPIPPSAETSGQTEAILGNWLNNNKAKRHDLVVASKIAGPGLKWIREGDQITGKNVIEAVNSSLKRLKTDYIDLYQLHWPNRVSPHFGKQWPNQIPLTTVNAAEQTDQMHDILTGLSQCVTEGKIRYCGLSDETPWGINTYLKLAREHNLPKMVSIQNEFSLLHSKDWPYLIENCVHEDIAYLPWSPLATGMLTGKYLNGTRPKGSRWTLIQRNGLFRDTPLAQQAAEKYCQLAKSYHMTPAELALAWCNHIDGVSSTIIGATSIIQLKENINAFSKPISDELSSDIEEILKQYPATF